MATIEPVDWTDHALRRLSEAGYRRGGARTAVVEMLGRQSCAVSARDIDDALRGEGRFFGRAYKRPDVERMDSATLQPSSLHRALLDAAYLRRWIERSVWTRADDAEAVLDELTAVCTRHILRRALAGSGKRLVGDKTPFLNPGAVAELARSALVARFGEEGERLHARATGQETDPFRPRRAPERLLLGLPIEPAVEELEPLDRFGPAGVAGERDRVLVHGTVTTDVWADQHSPHQADP